MQDWKVFVSFLVEIAEVCLFLASDKSSYITGSSVEVTGMSNDVWAQCNCNIRVNFSIVLSAGGLSL